MSNKLNTILNMVGAIGARLVISPDALGHHLSAVCGQTSRIYAVARHDESECSFDEALDTLAERLKPYMSDEVFSWMKVE